MKMNELMSELHEKQNVINENIETGVWCSLWTIVHKKILLCEKEELL